MCGIAGVLGSSTLSPELIRRMLDPIRHRGPDDQGIWVDSNANVGFGHRRLAVVDLSPQGHQPMESASGRYVLTYNGEIYNHAELRHELDTAGLTPHRGWRGHSDTETLLEAISAWGLKATLGKCVGMFAFGLWDKKERVLFLVRDRFGEKPLYYGWAGGDFLFASELKAIRVHPRFDHEINRSALAAFVSRTYVPAPLSIYRGVFKLEPGCILEVRATALQRPQREPPSEHVHDGGLRLCRYWSYSDVVRTGLEQQIENEQEALQQLDQALATAIRGQSVADVPVGAFLSGGIDSSLIVALYQKYSSTPVRSFTIGFEEARFDEAAHAKAVASHLGTIHDEHYVTVDEARDLIPLLPTIYDEPFADSSQIPTLLVSRFAREQVTVALSGDGGDELFGGYNRHVMAPALWSKLQRLPRPVRSAAGSSLGHISPKVWNQVLSLLGRKGLQLGPKLRAGFRIAGAADCFDDVHSALIDEWWSEPSPAVEEGATAPLDLDVGRDAPDAVRMMYCDAISYLPDDILCKVDRAAMSISLETRVPFLDHRVADVAARIPLSMKIRRSKGKRVLRDLLSRELPPELFERPKSGFAVPVGEWIGGSLRDWAEDLLDPVAMRAEGWFKADIVQRRWQQHLSGRRDSTAALWAILMFQSWLRAQQRLSSMAA